MKDSHVGFSRVLARREVLTLSFGAMIGWSWVLLTGDWIARAGSMGALIAFAIGGTAVIFISLTYAELAAAMPKAGGEHVYTMRAFGRLRSFVCTWAIVMAYVAVPVFESAALPTAMEYLFPEMQAVLLWRVLDADVYLSLVAVGVGGAVIMTIVNLLGIRFAAIVQSTITGLFFLVGLMFLTGAFVNGSTDNIEPLLTDSWSGMLGVLIMTPALLVGFDVIPQSAEEIDLPPEQIGRLLVFSVVMAVIWYGCITLGVAMSLGPEARAASTMATPDATAAAWSSPLAGKLMVIAGIGGIMTSWNAFIIGGSRVIYALAESGMLPSAFARLHPRYHTPYLAILLIGGLSCISPFFGRTILVWIIDASSFAIVIAYGMVAWAFLTLRRTEPEMDRPFRVRNGKLVGYAALILSIGMGLVYLPWSPAALVWPYEWAMVLGWALFGAVLYLIASYQADERSRS